MKRGIFFTLILIPFLSICQPPPGYYNAATGLSCAPLKTALQNIITIGHTNQGYTALWAQYQLSDVKPREVGSGSGLVIWDIYSDNPNGTDPYNFTPGTGTGGQQDQGTGGTSEGQRYNREHSVPISWHAGAGNEGSFSGSDYHHVFPTDKKVNSERGNLPYGEVAVATWTSLNGSKVGSSAIAGITGPVFEPIDEYKGDVARAFLYFVTRYGNDMPSWGNNTGAATAFEANTFPSVDIPYLKMMIQWHYLDPVSTKEVDRNNAAYTYQGNRNPFVDYPQYVAQVWNANCPGLGALPVDVFTFGGKLEGRQVVLKWEVGTELGLDRYEVERSRNGSAFETIGMVKAAGHSQYAFSDNAENHNGRRVYYRLKKVDKDGRFAYSAVFSIHIPLNTKFSFFPNPASSVVKLRLHGNASPGARVFINDMYGRVVFTAALNETGMMEIPVSRFMAGNYFLHLRVNGETYREKLVIIH